MVLDLPRLQSLVQQQHLREAVVVARGRGAGSLETDHVAGLQVAGLIEMVDPLATVARVEHGHAGNLVVDADHDALVGAVVVHQKAHVVSARRLHGVRGACAGGRGGEVAEAALGEDVHLEPIALKLIVVDDDVALIRERGSNDIQPERPDHVLTLGDISRSHDLLPVGEGDFLDDERLSGVGHTRLRVFVGHRAVTQRPHPEAHLALLGLQVEVAGDEQLILMRGEDVARPVHRAAVRGVRGGARCAAAVAEHVLHAQTVAAGALIDVRIHVDVKDGVIRSRRFGEARAPDEAVPGDVAELDQHDLLRRIVALGALLLGGRSAPVHLGKRLRGTGVGSERHLDLVGDAVAVGVGGECGGGGAEHDGGHDRGVD